MTALRLMSGVCPLKTTELCIYPERVRQQPTRLNYAADLRRTSLLSDPSLQQWGIKNTPLRRLGDPKDLVGAAVFLASADADYITAQTLNVDGGNWMS